MGHDDLRTALRAQWSAASGAWAENVAFVESQGAEAADAMLRLAGVARGDRVLELACGPGGVGLAAAQLVGADGEAVLSDVVAEMTATARDRAAALGLANVSVRELDLERIDEPDGAFDAVLCRMGLMLVPEPDLAAREIRRVLRGGGRAAVAVWGAADRNPWLSVVLDAVGAELGATIPPPGIPSPFSLDDPDVLGGLLRDAGLSGVVVEALETRHRFASIDDWWSVVLALIGPLAQALAALPDATVASIRSRARDAIGAFERSGGLEVPALTLVAAGRHGS